MPALLPPAGRWRRRGPDRPLGGTTRAPRVRANGTPSAPPSREVAVARTLLHVGGEVLERYLRAHGMGADDHPAVAAEVDDAPRLLPHLADRPLHQGVGVA